MIVDLLPSDTLRIAAISDLLVAGFADVSPRYVPTHAAAREVVLKSFGPEKLSRVLLTKQGDVGGWIGGDHAYGRVWELHPIVARRTVAAYA